MGIRVGEVGRVRSLECTSCLRCVSACRVEGALTVRTRWGARVSPWILPALALGVLAIAYVVARATGYWESSLSVDDFARAYRTGLRGR